MEDARDEGGGRLEQRQLFQQAARTETAASDSWQAEEEDARDDGSPLG